MKIKSPYLVKPGAKFRLKDYSTDDTGKFKKEEDCQDELEQHYEKLSELQEILFAECKHALLIVLQAMDTGGKDGTIRHIFHRRQSAGRERDTVQGADAARSRTRLSMAAHAAVPRLGTIGIFNRSHYEDVLVTRVHKTITDKEAKRRFREINQFEEMLTDNGVTILKFFLHISHKEQTARLKARCDDNRSSSRSARATFTNGSLGQISGVLRDAIDATSQKHAPWFVIPADYKWYRNAAISRIIVEALEGMNLKYPQPAFDVSKVCGQL